MLNTLKILTTALLISLFGCDGVEVNLGEDESAEKNNNDDDEFEQNIICTEDAMLVCKEITSGVYIETALGREGPKCEFPTDCLVDIELCK